MSLNNQLLKVDQTCLPSEHYGILVSNINIPESEFENLDSVIERARQFIILDYSEVPNVQYRVCATYTLRNAETGDLRIWTGSFNPRNNETNALSDYQTFAPNFNTVVKNASAYENIFSNLTIRHSPTNWVFVKLNSIIISVQAKVSMSHHTILRRNLLGRGRRSRSIRSFLLP